MRGYKRYLFFVILSFFVILVKVDANTYESYKIGDEVTYNGIKFYVIEDSGEDQSYVTLLKQQPLTVEEVNTYGAGHVNMYVTDVTSPSYQKAYNQGGYGAMAYYASSMCGSDALEGCTTDYDKSEIKYVIDAWSKDKFDTKDLIKDKKGYTARLLSLNELIDNLGYTLHDSGTTYIPSEEHTPIWLNGSNYSYWTMSGYEDSNYNVWAVNPGIAGVYNSHVSSVNYSVVRPVVSLKKGSMTKDNKKTILDTVFYFGDTVEYNEMDFYVLKNSKQSDNTVTLIKKEPLRISEVSDLINSTEIKKLINKQGPYLSVPYFSGDMCVSGGDVSGCKNDLDSSPIKQILDVWSASKLKKDDLINDSLGYKVRLITYDEYIENCEITEYTTPSGVNKSIIPLYEWMYNFNYDYWTMSPYDDSYDSLYYIYSSGNMYSQVVSGNGAIRPVITLKKANYNEEAKVDKNNQIVSVPDTFLEKSVIVVIIGLLFIVVGITISYIAIKKKKFTKNK